MGEFKDGRYLGFVVAVVFVLMDVEPRSSHILGLGT